MADYFRRWPSSNQSGKKTGVNQTLATSEVILTARLTQKKKNKQNLKAPIFNQSFFPRQNQLTLIKGPSPSHLWQQLELCCFPEAPWHTERNPASQIAERKKVLSISLQSSISGQSKIYTYRYMVKFTSRLSLRSQVILFLVSFRFCPWTKAKLYLGKFLVNLMILVFNSSVESDEEASFSGFKGRTLGEVRKDLWWGLRLLADLAAAGTAL